MNSERIDLGAKTGSKPVRVVVCGEVSAGKSTVLNALLRSRILPDNLGSGVRPVVYLRSGDGNDANIIYSNGESHKLDGISDMDSLRGAKQISLLSDQPHLSGLELIEVPFTNAAEMTQDQLDLVASADVMVWVTIASQAWRLTEKSIVEAFGKNRPSRGILVLSRGDKVRKSIDRQKLLDRVKRETAEFFQHHIFVGGSRSQIENSAESDESWQAIGGSELASLLGGYSGQATSRKVSDPKQDADVSNIVKLDVYKKPVADKAPRPVVEQPPATVKETPAAAAPAPADQGDTQPAEMDTSKEAEVSPKLGSLAEDLPPGVCSGFVLHSDEFNCIVVTGELEPTETAAKACREARAKLVSAFPSDSGVFEACTICSDNHVLVFQDIKEVGFLFLYADTRTMNFGNAQRVMANLVAACLADPE